MDRIFGLPSALAHSVTPPAEDDGEGSILPPCPEPEASHSQVHQCLVSPRPASDDGNGGVDVKCIPQLSLTLTTLLALTIDQLTLQVITQIDGEKTVEEIIYDTEASRSEILGIIWDLSEAQMIVLIEPLDRFQSDVSRCA